MRELQRAFVAATAYALVLSTPWGRRIRLDQTWVTVVVGTALTLWFYYRHRPDPDFTAIKFFAVTGIPIVAMCVAEDMARREKVRQWVIGRENGPTTH